MDATLKILLIEDDPGDVELARESFLEGKTRIRLHVARDGVEAIAFLEKSKQDSAGERPDLIFLDLNLPRKDGREVLLDIKRDEELKTIPVIVLSTSASEEDIYYSYRLGCNCFVTKPVGLDQFNSAMNAIHDFWLSTAKLPRN